MGRHAVRGDRKHRPRAFALSDEQHAFVELYGEQHDMRKSQVVRRALRLLEEAQDGDFRRELALRRMRLGKEARAELEKPAPTPRCPQCGEVEMYVALGNDRFRCDNCLWRSD